MADYKQEIKIGTCCQLSKYGKTFEEDCDTGIVVSIKQRRCNHFNDLEGLDVTFFDGIKLRKKLQAHSSTCKAAS